MKKPVSGKKKTQSSLFNFLLGNVTFDYDCHAHDNLHVYIKKQMAHHIVRQMATSI